MQHTSSSFKTAWSIQKTVLFTKLRAHAGVAGIFGRLPQEQKSWWVSFSPLDTHPRCTDTCRNQHRTNTCYLLTVLPTHTLSYWHTYFNQTSSLGSLPHWTYANLNNTSHPFLPCFVDLLPTIPLARGHLKQCHTPGKRQAALTGANIMAK